MTVLALVIGSQLFFILRDVRKLLNQTNSVVGEFRKVGSNIGNGYSEVLGFFSGIKKLLFVVDLLSKRKKNKKN